MRNARPRVFQVERFQLRGLKVLRVEREDRELRIYDTPSNRRDYGVHEFQRQGGRIKGRYDDR